MQLQNSNLGTTVFVCGRLYQLGNTILRQTNWAYQTQINKKIQNYHEVFFSITWPLREQGIETTMAAIYKKIQQWEWLLDTPKWSCERCYCCLKNQFLLYLAEIPYSNMKYPA